MHFQVADSTAASGKNLIYAMNARSLSLNVGSFVQNSVDFPIIYRNTQVIVASLSTLRCVDY